MFEHVKRPAFLEWVAGGATIQSGIEATMQFRQMSEFIADTRRRLIGVQLLLESDEAEIQDRYGVHKGLGLVARRKRLLVRREAEVIDAVRMTASDSERTLANCCSKHECPRAAILLVWQGFDNPNR
jgi:hypothetical protein